MDTLIIAEAGVNHNGDIVLAKELIHAAAEAGANVVKFQTFKADMLVKRNTPMAEYQSKNIEQKQDQYEMLKKLELDRDTHYELYKTCQKNGIIFSSTAFDMESTSQLSELGLPFWKIPSGEISNVPYLRKIGLFNKPVLMSTGMSSLADIEFALNTLLDTGLQRDKITVLHCNTDYPTVMEDVNLLAMITIKNAFKVKIGYSDHTLGIEVPIAAVALGATIIEKHFTLDRNLKGPDHKASLNPGEFNSMVKAIRNIEMAIGDGIKGPSPSEIKNMKVAQKSIFAKCSIKKGECFSVENVIVKRPGDGISPKRWDEVIGKVALKDYSIDDYIYI